jgi:tRNA(Ile)-lysidine synthase
LEFQNRRLQLGPGTSETDARAARYAALEAMRIEQHGDWIVTAHHADDQAETVLLRVLGGTGPAGLAAMAAVQGSIVRPLLPFRREELARYLLDRNLQAWEDPANRDPRHLRSWARGSLLPIIREKLPDVDAQLLRVSRQAGFERIAWDRVLEAIPELGWRPEPGGGSVAAACLAAYDSTLGNALLRAAARRAGLTLGIARAQRAIEFLAQAQSGSRMELGGGWTLEVEFGRARLRGVKTAEPLVESLGSALMVVGALGEANFGRWALRWRPEPAPDQQARERTGRLVHPRGIAGPALAGGRQHQAAQGSRQPPGGEVFSGGEGGSGRSIHLASRAGFGRTADLGARCLPIREPGTPAWSASTAC